MTKQKIRSPISQPLDVDSIQDLPLNFLLPEEGLDPILMDWSGVVLRQLGKFADYDKGNLAQKIQRATSDKEIASAILEVVARRLAREIEVVERLGKHPKEPSKGIISTADNLVTFILQESITSLIGQQLTPQYLTVTVLPYLNAIAEIQNAVDEIAGRETREIKIHSLTQNSPISVSLDGAAETVQLIKDTVVPWRRKHAETMALLMEQERQAEIESKKAEILERRAHAEKARVEAARQREEAEKLKLENEKTRLDLYRAKVLLALEILTQVAPNLSETERIAYVVKLLPPLEVLTSSRVEIVSDK
jgi:hypothetical protein